MASSDDGTGKRQPPISRQTSIYSLTLDEFQNALGEPAKNFGSMNMDEFLKNIWTAEESQAMAAAMGGEAGTSNLFRQPSVASLPQTLSTKTVDEVWKDIYKSSSNEAASHKAERQMTLGEMTLEDFLIKAGVVRDDNKEAVVEPSKRTKQQPEYYAAAAMVQQQQQQFMQQQAEVAAYLSGTKALGNGANGAMAGNLAMGLGNGLGHHPGGSPSSPGSDSQGNGFGLGFGFDGRGRKRGLEGPVEVVIQRRQRRMIKNRESAARSRARKQAYTVELEAEVSNLKEENTRLKKLQEEAELRARKRSQMLEVIVAKNEATLAKPRPLRRTQTLP